MQGRWLTFSLTFRKELVWVGLLRRGILGRGCRPRSTTCPGTSTTDPVVVGSPSLPFQFPWAGLGMAHYKLDKLWVWLCSWPLCPCPLSDLSHGLMYCCSLHKTLILNNCLIFKSSSIFLFILSCLVSLPHPQPHIANILLFNPSFCIYYSFINFVPLASLKDYNCHCL